LKVRKAFEVLKGFGEEEGEREEKRKLFQDFLNTPTTDSEYLAV
jgi:hypothetical protein